MLQTVIEIVGFYHPAAWWVSRRIRVERENCCDDIAVSVCGDGIGYAKALTAVEELRSNSHRLAVAATGGSLFDRVRRLVRSDSQQNRPARTPALITLLLVLLLLALPVTVAITENTHKTDVQVDGEEMRGEVADVNKAKPKIFTLSDEALMSLDFHGGSTARVIAKRDAPGPGVEFDIYFPPAGYSLSYTSSHTSGKGALINIDPNEYIGYALKFTLLDIKSTTPKANNARLSAGANIGSPGRYQPAFMRFSQDRGPVTSSTGFDPTEVRHLDYIGFRANLFSKEFSNTNGLTVTIKVEAVPGAQKIEPQIRDMQLDGKEDVLKRFFKKIDSEIHNIKSEYPQLVDWDREKTEAKGFITGKEIIGKERLVYNHAASTERYPGLKAWCGKNGCYIMIKHSRGFESPYMNSRRFPVNDNGSSILAVVITGSPEAPELEEKIFDKIESVIGRLTQESTLKAERKSTKGEAVESALSQEFYLPWVYRNVYDCAKGRDCYIDLDTGILFSTDHLPEMDD
jgi:hypothetical protein